MPNCDFYATLEDHGPILRWLFDEGTCQIYEIASDYEQPLKQFFSSKEILAQFDRLHRSGANWTEVYLQLYVLGAGPPFIPRRVALNPQHCDGATFRYVAEGWGLVQLYLGTSAEPGLISSHTNHYTQKGAETWSKTSQNSDVALWDFKRISAFSSRLNREIKKLSVGSLGSRAVLPGALRLWQSGTPLLPYRPTENANDFRVNK